MDVLIIDPWGTGSTANYLKGLIFGLYEQVQLTVVTNCGHISEVDQKYKVKRIFFPLSDSMKKGKMRKVIRGCEYICAYISLLLYLSFRKVDIIHINWLLMYKIDNFFLPLIHNKCKKLVYTAHNVIPHIENSSHRTQLDKIYKEVDCIILHGNGIKKEFEALFPNYVDKTYIQFHGANTAASVSYDIDKVDSEIIKKVGRFERKYIFLGRIFYNKGVDRLIEIWQRNKMNGLLIIAGEVGQSYKDLNNATAKLPIDNVLFLDYFVDDNTLNFLIDQSNLILLPYRHASMSGVVFTAADFAKPILTTNVGAIPEYLENHSDSFIAENSDKDLEKIILRIDKTVTNEMLTEYGKNLRNNIIEKCSWKKIGKEIYNYVYLGEK